MMKSFAFLAALFTFSAVTPAHALGNLLLSSPLVQQNGTLPRSAAGNQDGCNGENISPTLDWSGAPEGTQSFAVTLFDPNAGQLHWIVTNIPALPSTLPPDSGNPDKLPQGVNVIPNSFGTEDYVGPCPAPGQVGSYEFTIYAMPETQIFYSLSTVDPSTIDWLRERALETATLTVKYGR